ncbi:MULTISPECIES: TIGR02300 family protein [Paracoccus]|uniref:TIGR02300 family protein n=1 Tax=Paracoccus onubensis TaxID=1675788 RepID=A0A418SMM7_9RHOB|nr:TIGR02300 family protein [Paracoccus onubensis]MDP0929609.1 TIGR02300 family protein [Paracoccus onubensis]RJE82211.1 TIGR02300 family protein [Paracoccus onubensis]
MPKEEWGTKRLCPHCATRFYDLNNNPMTCPACGSEMTLESLKEGRTKSLVSDKTAADSDDDANLVDDDDDLDTDGGDLDDDLLEDDDDDGDVSLDDIADVSNEDDE